MRQFLTTLFILILLQCSAQKGQWERGYPIDGGPHYTYENWVFEAYDKGFLIATNYFNGVLICKTDVNGNILWERKLSQGNLFPQMGGFSITPDGGCIVEGCTHIPGSKSDSTNDNFLLKLNACGQVEWSKLYDLNQYSIGGPVAVLKDGDIVVSSYVEINKGRIGNYYDSWTFRTDPQGNIKWQVFDNLNTMYFMVDNNQTILRTGFCWLPYPGEDPNVGVIKCGLIKMDSSGKRCWYAEYSVEKHIDCAGVASVPTEENSYLTVAGDFDVNVGDAILLIKFDANGVAQWSKLIGDTTQEEDIWDMVAMNDGNYLVSAATNFGQFPYTDASDLKLLKINTQGQVLKQAVYPDPGLYNWNFHKIGVTQDNKFIMAASINYGGIRDSLLVYKFNNDLELDTFYTHDTNKYDYLCNHKITFDSTVYINTNNPVPITIPFPADTQTIVNPGSFAIYPNPISSCGKINILCPIANTSASASIYDMLGRRIGQYSFMSTNLGRASINPGLLAPGCYIIILEQEGKKYVQKLMLE